MQRTDGRRAAMLAVLFAVGLLAVLLGAHVTPRGYHGHVRYVAPHSYPPRPPSTSSGPGGTNTPAGVDLRRHPGNTWVNIALLLTVAAIVILVVVIVWIYLPRPGRWARRRGVSPTARPSAQHAADELARRLAHAVDAGFDELAAGPVAEAIIACWLRLRDAAVAAGVERRQSDTAEEFVSRVLESAQVRPAPLQDLAQLYREARFSAHPMSDTDRAAARAALEAVGADLVADVHA